MKMCGVTGCNVEIPDWMDYCPTHYASIQQEREQSELAKKMPQQQQQPQQQRPMPQQPRQIQQEPEYEDVEDYGKEEQQLQQQPRKQRVFMTEATKKVEKKPLDTLIERERLIVKQTCLKASVDMLSNMDVGEADPDDIAEEIKKLTIKLYRVVVEHNEE